MTIEEAREVFDLMSKNEPLFTFVLKKKGGGKQLFTIKKVKEDLSVIKC